MGERLELRLKSPVGAEPAVYPWPLPVYVSVQAPVRDAPPPRWRELEAGGEKLRLGKLSCDLGGGYTGGGGGA